jgi:eukaryotic-like serine/threonine-protein kinase
MTADPQHTTPSNQSIYFAALKLPNDAERQKFLNQACGEDVERRRSIERLLAVGEPPADSPLDRVINQLGPDNTVAGDLPEGDDCQTSSKQLKSTDLEHPTIDFYTLLEQIGEGGMGAVYLAQQSEPIQRMVALKLIKPGMDSRDVIARFEAERQTLALMDNPNIAQVLDAGTTPDGRPYFVMELVRGVPITEYCEEERLSVRDRISLFIDVCRAVQHAHQRGIIHRDLKPSNLMVTLHDGIPVVKVIDFGVAKALNRELTEKTLLTQFSQMIGTPLYMSPEQAEMSGLDIDTRSDVYSLGVVLYELLTGTTPFDHEKLVQAGFDGMRRIICEVEPPRPSQQIRTLKADSTSLARNRPADPRQLSLLMKRELDWIVMKALEKNRNRRYESASSLAADLIRYLAGEPVQAYPPSVLYRLRKLTRRYKGFVTAAALTVLLMLIGLMISARLAVRASRAEQVARTAQEEAEKTSEEMRSLLYASDVMLASRDWQQNDSQKLRERLARHIPTPGQRDLRSFEWHYLWKQQEVEEFEIANLGSAVYDIALAPDGKLFAAVGAAAVIHFFDLASGAPWSTIDTHQLETNGIAFSPDSSRIAAAGDDGTLRVWDLGTRRELWNTEAHDGIAYQVRYSPSGEILVTCGEDDRVRLWDATSGSSLGTLNEHQEDVETIDVSASGIVAAGDQASKVSLWDLPARAAVWTAGDRESIPTSSVVFSDHGCLAQANILGQLIIMDIHSQAIVAERQLESGIQSLAFAPNGSWLAVGDRAGQLRVINFERGAWDLRATRQWAAHDGRIYALDVTPDGKRIISGGADGRIIVSKPRSAETDRVVSFPNRFWKMKPINGGNYLLGGQGLTVHCDQAGNVLQEFGPPGYWDIDLASGGNLMFGVNSHELAAWNLKSEKKVFQSPQQEQVEYLSLAATQDGQTVCVACKLADGSRQLQIIDVGSGRPIKQFPVRSANHLAISPDAHWLIFDSDNELILYDLTSQTIVDTWHGHRGGINGLRFSPDGNRLGSVSEDRTLKLWSVPTGELLYSVIAHGTDALDLAFTPDGRRIATSGDDLTLRIWDGQNAQPLWEYSVAEGQARRLCFSSDGHRLLCLCDRHRLLILDGSPK